MPQSGLGSNEQSALVYGCALLSTRGLVYYLLFLALVILGLMFFDKGIARASQPAALVKMLDMPPAFQPSQITIKAGAAVEWQNVGNEIHHATSDPSLAIKSSEVANPHGVAPFDSGFLRPGESYTHTFFKPGVYRYTCVVHETKGMTGEIVVK